MPYGETSLEVMCSCCLWLMHSRCASLLLQLSSMQCTLLRLAHSIQVALAVLQSSPVCRSTRSKTCPAALLPASSQHKHAVLAAENALSCIYCIFSPRDTPFHTMRTHHAGRGTVFDEPRQSTMLGAVQTALDPAQHGGWQTAQVRLATNRNGVFVYDWVSPTDRWTTQPSIHIAWLHHCIHAARSFMP